MTIGPDFHRDAVLADGTRVTLRMIRPSDAAELRRQLRRLSPDSRYRRFLSVTTDLSEDALRYLTEVDGVNHVAVVATAAGEGPAQEVGLGIARFVRLPGEPEVAEAALTVMDEMQRKGLGRLLLAALAEAALERGVRVFRAEVLTGNAPVLHMLRDAGAILREQVGGAAVFDVPLGGSAGADAGADAEAGAAASAAPATGDVWRDHPLRRLLRLVAASLLAIRFRRGAKGE